MTAASLLNSFANFGLKKIQNHQTSSPFLTDNRENSRAYLLVVGELDGLDLLRAVLVVVEVVLDCESLEKLHCCLRSNLWHTIEEKNVLLRVLGIVEVIGVELEEGRTLFLLGFCLSRRRP